MTDLDTHLATLLAVPDRAPDVAFANEAALRLSAERALAARLADDRRRTGTMLVATLSLAIGLGVFARTEGFGAATGGGGGALVALVAVLALWLTAQGGAALAGE